MKNNFTNIKKVLEFFFKIGKISTEHDNINYLFDVAIQIENKIPREKYKRHFEELRLRNIYSELEPLTVFFTFLKTTFKVDNLEKADILLGKNIGGVNSLLLKENIHLSDFMNLNSKEMIDFTNDFHKLFGLTFKSYKHHVKRFSEYEMIHDDKNITL